MITSCRSIDRALTGREQIYRKGAESSGGQQAECDAAVCPYAGFLDSVSQGYVQQVDYVQPVDYFPLFVICKTVFGILCSVLVPNKKKTFPCCQGASRRKGLPFQALLEKIQVMSAKIEVPHLYISRAYQQSLI